MQDYQQTIHINASIIDVYNAIAQEQGVQKWWTANCQIETKVNGKARFSFGNCHEVMIVEKLVPNSEVVWKCIEQEFYEGPMKDNTEWINTRLIFQLSEDQNGVNLLFTHEGLNKNLDCYSICENGWNFFLNASLKPYLETGEGKPA